MITRKCLQEILLWRFYLGIGFSSETTQLKREIKQWLCSIIKRQVKSKYDALIKMNNGPNKNDELKKFMKEIYTPPIVREKKKGTHCFTKEREVKVRSLRRKGKALINKKEIVRYTV